MHAKPLQIGMSRKKREHEEADSDAMREVSSSARCSTRLLRVLVLLA